MQLLSRRYNNLANLQFFKLKKSAEFKWYDTLNAQ